MPHFRIDTVHAGNTTAVKLYVDEQFYKQVEYSPRLEGHMIQSYEQVAESYLKYHYYAKQGLGGNAATSPSPAHGNINTADI